MKLYKRRCSEQAFMKCQPVGWRFLLIVVLFAGLLGTADEAQGLKNVHQEHGPWIEVDNVNSGEVSYVVYKAAYRLSGTCFAVDIRSRQGPIITRSGADHDFISCLSKAALKDVLQEVLWPMAYARGRHYKVFIGLARQPGWQITARYSDGNKFSTVVDKNHLVVVVYGIRQSLKSFVVRELGGVRTYGCSFLLRSIETRCHRMDQ